MSLSEQRERARHIVMLLFFFYNRKKRRQIVHHSSLEHEERDVQSYNANRALPQSLYVTQRTWGNLFKHTAQSAYWLWTRTCLSPNILTTESWRSITWLRRQDLHIHTVPVQRHSTQERPKLVPENPEALWMSEQNKATTQILAPCNCDDGIIITYTNI